MTPRAAPMHLRNRHLVVFDAISMVVAIGLAYSVRFEGVSWLADGQGEVCAWYLGIAVPLRLIGFWSLGLYRRLWAFASVADLERVLAAALLGGAVSCVVGFALLSGLGLTTQRMPISVVALDTLLMAVAITAPRMALRFLKRRVERRRGERRGERRLPLALVVGAGAAGQMVARELGAQPRSGFRPVGFLDDDRSKQGLMLGDLPVLGTVADMPRLATAMGVRHVIIAMPSASGSTIRQIMQLARSTGLDTRTVPSLHEQITHSTGVAALRELRIEDLLQREPIDTDTGGVRTLVTGRTVLITGAGGSIGAELCRQLAEAQPARLVLLGRGENSIFDIQQELRSAYPMLPLIPVILDVRDRNGMARVVLEYAPVAIFHAAAHKHVPLMEANVLEAFRNNVAGTQSVVDAALAAGVPHLVLISTDKAVRPTSVMGATKRIAEQVVQLAARDSGRAYVSVRFGNVLGSRGSVVPTFLRQIRAGGPVLVTHPDMRRYFMTIPEAVQLVLQAFVMGTGGEVFCLDMGEPVPIVNLARDLIQLTVTDPDQEIEIRFTGARPGEKLYEEMFFGSEAAAPTSHPKVLRARNTDVPAVAAERITLLQRELVDGVTDAYLRDAIEQLVDDFRTELAPMELPLRTTPTTPAAGVAAAGTARDMAASV
jgi:FlaA1/EpsC-like NDP-sugar epimerase